MKIAKFVILFICCFGISQAAADIYKYVDQNGDVKFVNQLSSVPGQYLDQLETVIKSAPAPAKPVSVNSRPPANNAPSRSVARKKNVEIYVTDWCPYCVKLEKFLKSNSIKYKKYDVEKSQNGRTEYKSMGGGGVPITKVGSTVIRGFDPDKILSALK